AARPLAAPAAPRAPAPGAPGRGLGRQHGAARAGAPRPRGLGRRALDAGPERLAAAPGSPALRARRRGQPGPTAARLAAPALARAARRVIQSLPMQRRSITLATLAALSTALPLGSALAQPAKQRP